MSEPHLDDREASPSDYYASQSWFWRWINSDLIKYAKLDEALDRASPHEYIGLVIGTNSRQVVTELKAIKWLLFAILILLLFFARYSLPTGWWKIW